jgi:hypothetical protein
MKTEEDEAFDDLAKRQGAWGGGFPAKRQMAADKLQEPWNEDEWRRNNWRCGHGWLRGEQCEICNAAQEPYDQTALELCNVCGWKTLIPDDGCLNCERAQPAQEPVAQGSKEHLKIMMEHSAWDDRLELSDALANIDEFYATAPPQRQWIWLSDADIAEVVDTTCQYTGSYEEYLIKKAERKIRSMNT